MPEPRPASPTADDGPVARWVSGGIDSAVKEYLRTKGDERVQQLVDRAKTAITLVSLAVGGYYVQKALRGK